MSHAVRVVFCVLCLASPLAFPKAGSFVVRGGPTLIANSVFGDASDPRHRIGGAALDLQGDDLLSFSVAYFVSDRVSVEYLGARQLDRALRFQGVGDFGEAIRLPPTITARYHFRPGRRWQPYVGAGVNWTNRLGQAQLSQQGDLRLGNALGFALQTGVYHNLTEHWVLNFEARYSDIRAELRARNRQVGTADLDPLVLAIKLGYRF